MIKNERQLRIAKAQLGKFTRTLKSVATAPPTDTHPLLQKAEQDALRSQMEELQSEIAEYEDLLAGRKEVLEMESFEDLPRSLIRARIAARFTQKALAERLGLKEQKIQRYEYDLERDHQRGQNENEEQHLFSREVKLGECVT